MKTNVVMRSTDRKLFGVTVRQETKDGFLNLSDLQDAYDIARGIHGWSERRINDIINNQNNRERIFYILEEQGIMFTSFPVFIEECEREGIIRVLKRLNVYKASGSRTNRTTSCNPYIWTLIAMELNPMLYAKVMKWLTDSLILNRIEAGDFYRDFSRAIRPLGPDYVKIAKALNYVVFNRHEAGIRNIATKEQLNDLIDLEKKMAFAIDMGYIKTQSQLINSLRTMWEQKWSKKIFK
jgi:hypothetical protein